MTNRIVTGIGGMLALLLIIASSGNAQIAEGSRARVTTRIQYYRWSIEQQAAKTTFSQASVPVSGLVPLRKDAELIFSVTGSDNSFDGPALNHSITGATDLRLQVNHSFMDDQLLLSAGINLPTGNDRLDYATDTAIINLLSQNYVYLPQRRFGRGLGFNGLIGAAGLIGAVRVSGGFLYEYTGEYTPYGSLRDYDPGNVYSVSLSADWRGEHTLLYAKTGVSLFTWDTYDGTKAMQQKPQYAFRMGAVRQFRESEVGVSVRGVLRGNQERALTQDTFTESQLYGNEIQVSTYYRVFLEGGLRIGPVLDMRVVSANDDDSEGLSLDESYLAGAGAKAGQSISKHLSISIDGRYYYGKADGGQIDVTGFHATASVTSTF